MFLEELGIEEISYEGENVHYELDKDGNIIDPFNGIRDLQEKKISLIDKQGKALEEDPLRIFRGIRIAAKMNFDIDSNCHAQMEFKKKLLNGVAAERIYRELVQILITDKPSYYIRENLAIFFEILPELKPMHKFEQHNSWHIYDVLEHTLAVLDNTEKNIFLRFAALFHDSGKPSKFILDNQGIGHFYGHPEASEEIFEKVASRLKMDNKPRNLVSKLIRYHDNRLSRKPDKIREFLKKNGFEFTLLLFKLKRADNLGQNPEKVKHVLEELAETEDCIIVGRCADYVLKDNPIITYRCSIEYQNLKAFKDITFTRVDTGVNGLDGNDAPAVQAQYSVDGTTGWTLNLNTTMYL